MALTGNKGEWSEIYTLLKLLGEGKVYAGDQNLNIIKNLFYPIVSILRQEQPGKLQYIPYERDVVIQTAAGEEWLRLPAAVFLDEAESLLEAINSGVKTFSVPHTEQFMQKIGCSVLKAKSSNKADIHIVLHDPRTKINSEMGFSIKSQLGGDSTLINASKATNFTFRIENVRLQVDDVNRINGLDSNNKVFDRYNAIKQLGGVFVFDSVDNHVFKNNLILIDSDLPQIIASLLIKRIENNETNLSMLTKILGKENPVGYDVDYAALFYEYKIKQLLTAAALGMVPAKQWLGRYEANGGYLVVKKSGDIVCYHFYDRNRFEDYLFTNAYLERASTSRHEYAVIESKNINTQIFKLNLQVRLR